MSQAVETAPAPVGAAPPARIWQYAWCATSALFGFLASAVVLFEFFVCFGPCEESVSGLATSAASMLMFACMLAAAAMINPAWRYDAIRAEILAATGLIVVQQFVESDVNRATLLLVAPFLALALAAHAWNRSAESRIFIGCAIAIAAVIGAIAAM